MEKLVLIPTGELSEEGKRRLAEHCRKRQERLDRLVADCKNSVIEKGIDGFVKITIPNLGIVTWASDFEDAQVAITEAVNIFADSSDKFGDGFEEELKKINEED